MKNHKPLNTETARALKPGTKLVFINAGRNTVSALNGALCKVGPKGTFTQFGRTWLDIIWTSPEARGQNDGGYHPYDFAVAHRSLAPQAREVLKMLKEAGRITGVQAWNILKVRSLPRRISDLKEAGYNIKKAMKEDHTGQRYAEYTLA
ncbi:hypothetical protein J1C56_02235 [Aminobacter anthyllidis]|uniref:Winged helix-turn-helix domain-containing protein n=2 Tax=Aminobacter anthyllidis TaxID=1035067 RepID=A0A9X1A6Y2_9HYPH|nr:hypothetical protein [Aminobacter anthyllidis]